MLYTSGRGYTGSLAGQTVFYLVYTAPCLLYYVGSCDYKESGLQRLAYLGEGVCSPCVSKSWRGKLNRYCE